MSDIDASAFGFTVYQVRQWEQGRHRPAGGVHTYLMAIERDPDVILRLLNGDSAKTKAA